MIIQWNRYQTIFHVEKSDCDEEHSVKLVFFQIVTLFLSKYSETQSMQDLVTVWRDRPNGYHSFQILVNQREGKFFFLLRIKSRKLNSSQLLAIFTQTNTKNWVLKFGF